MISIGHSFGLSKSMILFLLEVHYNESQCIAANRWRVYILYCKMCCLFRIMQARYLRIGGACVCWSVNMQLSGTGRPTQATGFWIWIAIVSQYYDCMSLAVHQHSRWPHTIWSLDGATQRVGDASANNISFRKIYNLTTLFAKNY